ncbi:MAG: Fibrillarin-like rRNA/tRNA 2'-O-methyltransferase [Candidatus Bathyarchaeota archaeon BA1]|nr:MAG: Fibrillarin-like rRNA/tRNA 2'-O-methyltransferase [Candidatus Bathyarchaeota archaeon BA1]
MAVRVEPHPRFPEIYWVTLEDGFQRLATKNLAPGKNVYGERLITCLGVEYRLWDPFRSKFSGSILKGLETVPIQPNHKVLYLGAASGTTASHVSDIVGERGHVYCIEFAPRAIRELVNNVCAFRPNMSPILADARLPERYSALLEKVDDIYADLAQPNQAEIVANNAHMFLKDGGWVMLAIKAQSIDVTKEPSEIYKREIGTLKARGFFTKEIVHLDPYDKAHAMIVARYLVRR